MAAINPYRLFIDTGAFVAIIDKRDSYYNEAWSFYTSLERHNELFTSLMVVSETYTWLRYQAGYHLATRFLDIIDKAEKAGYLTILIPNSEMKGKIHAVLKNYHDQNLSYTDAASFVILETMNIQDVFGFDSHFYIINRNLWPSVKKT